MNGKGSDADLPVSWDEGREIVIVVLMMATVLFVISPFMGWLALRFPGSFTEHVATITRNVSTTSGLFVLAAGVLLATTPPTDVVPALRRVVIGVATVVVVLGVVAIVVELTRASGAGFSGRLQTIFGRSGPGVLLAGTGRWLAARVIPFTPATDEPLR